MDSINKEHKSAEFVHNSESIESSNKVVTALSEDERQKNVEIYKSAAGYSPQESVDLWKKTTKGLLKTSESYYKDASEELKSPESTGDASEELKLQESTGGASEELKPQESTDGASEGQSPLLKEALEEPSIKVTINKKIDVEDDPINLATRSEYLEALKIATREKRYNNFVRGALGISMSAGVLTSASMIAANSLGIQGMKKFAERITPVTLDVTGGLIAAVGVISLVRSSIQIASVFKLRRSTQLEKFEAIRELLQSTVDFVLSTVSFISHFLKSSKVFMGIFNKAFPISQIASGVVEFVGALVLLYKSVILKDSKGIKVAVLSMAAAGLRCAAGIVFFIPATAPVAHALAMLSAALDTVGILYTWFNKFATPKYDDLKNILKTLDSIKEKINLFKSKKEWIISHDSVKQKMKKIDNQGMLDISAEELKEEHKKSAIFKEVLSRELNVKGSI